MINDITTAVAAVCLGIAGIQAAYQDAPDNLSVFPCAVIFAGDGTIERNMSVRSNHHNFKLQVYFSKGTDTASADSLAKQYIDLFVDTFDQHRHLQDANGNPTCVSSELTEYKYGVLSYGDTQYVGISWNLSVLSMKQVIYGG